MSAPEKEVDCRAIAKVTWHCDMTQVGPVAQGQDGVGRHQEHCEAEEGILEHCAATHQCVTRDCLFVLVATEYGQPSVDILQNP